MAKRLTWAEKMKLRKEKGLPMELKHLIPLAQKHKMTPEEITAQKRSWVIGQMRLSNPDLDKVTIEVLVDGLL